MGFGDVSLADPGILVHWYHDQRSSSNRSICQFLQVHPVHWLRHSLATGFAHSFLKGTIDCVLGTGRRFATIHVLHCPKNQGNAG